MNVINTNYPKSLDCSLTKNIENDFKLKGIVVGLLIIYISHCYKNLFLNK